MKQITNIIDKIKGIGKKPEGNLDALEDRIEYKFKDPKLLEMALMHRSYVNDARNNGIMLESNERLEFLGDAVLEIIVSEYLYTKYSDVLEGQLTKMRSNGVCESTLARLAKKINLGNYIYLAKGENLGGGRNKPSILADAFEAVIGAIYLDGSFSNAKKFVEEFMINRTDFSLSVNDDKTKLQEVLQKKGNKKIQYIIVKEKGPAHDKEFVIQVSCDGKVIGMGKGKSKKVAEQNAAREALVSLKVLEE
ncbi:MAG: ribonuclease III [Clostridiales bacterium GWE2_32_10]|nr:MAG: ribonuclease III [Clostridiales bacterium GWE2_32_10]HBY20457.1 ribonuclease III [Clostridiales bacterium]